MNWTRPLILAIMLLIGQNVRAEDLKVQEQRLLDQLSDIYLGSSGSIDEAILQLTTKCHTVSKEQQPRLWSRCFAFLYTYADQVNLKEQLPDAIQFARIMGFELERIELELTQTVNTKSQKTREEVLASFQQLLKDARSHGSLLLSGRIGLYLAEYLYEINDLPAAIQETQRCMEELQSEDATESLLYHNVLATMALMVYSNGEIQKAIALWTETLQWSQRRSHRGNQSIIAYNIANAMVNNDDGDDKRIQELFTLAQVRAHEIKNPHAEAVGYYGEGKWNVRRKKYNDALQALQKARKLFLDINPTFALLSLIYSAEALHELDRTSESLRALKQSEKELTPDLWQEKLMILDLRYKIHLKMGDSANAVRYLKSYLDAYKEQTEADKKSELQKLSTAMGIKVEEERTKILEKEKNLQAAKLTVEQERNLALAEQVSLLKKFRLVAMLATCMAVLALSAMLIVWRQSLEISRSRQRIKEILDNIHEGIVILDSALEVRSGYSPYLEVMLEQKGQSLVNRHINNLLFPSPPANAEWPIMIKDALTICIGEKEMTWNVNCGLLPAEITYGPKTFGLHWQALYNRQDAIRGYLVAIRDITEHRQMMHEMEVGKRRILELQARIEEILASDLKMVRRFFENVNSLLPEVSSWFQNGQNITMLFHKLHGWKGAARTLGLKQIANSIHHLESCLDLAQQKLKNSTFAQDKWKEFTDVYQAFSELLDQMLASTQNQSQALPENLYAYASGYTKEVSKRFLALQLPCEGISILDSVIHWRSDRLPVLHEVLLHAINNSIDHGFMWPSLQHRPLKSASIEIYARQQGETVGIEVRDNGAGINWEGLQKKAVERGFVPAPGHKLTDMLFMDGMSTAASATETSGRGVGLGAIKSICTELKGRVELDEAGPDGGTILSMTFPAAELCRLSPT